MRHPHQTAALARALESLREKKSLLIVSPTGSGKSYILLDILTSVPDIVLVVPSTEIGSGIYHKMTGINAEQPELEANRIWTSRRYYNELMAGRVKPPPALLFDEAHHVDNTHALISEGCGNPPTIGLTATAFRGTPAETVKLQKRWPLIYRALTLSDACARGIISRPDFSVWPLTNDDEIEVSNGEFVVSAVDGAVRNALPGIIERTRSFYTDRWTRPLMFRVSSVESASFVCDALNSSGLPAMSVTGGTKDRQTAFDACIKRTHALVQIRVVGEGVDLPVRIMIDAAPTLSPLLWTQAVGRITRPVGGEDPPQYICTNHNFARFAYIWEGLIPVNQIKDAQDAWGPEYQPSRRAMSRALNLEGLGKFTVSRVPLADGTKADTYALQTRDGLHQYSIILHPCLPEPFYFERSNSLTGETASSPDGWAYSKKTYGKWKRIPCIPETAGYTSVKPSVITPKMRAWWKRSRVGLDTSYEPNAREFQVLPVLIESGLKFKETT